MKNILICINDGLLKLRINRILSEKNFVFQITDRPIKRDDLVKYEFVIIHTSYRLSNLYNFIQNAIIQELCNIIYITSNTNTNPFNKLKEHTNLVVIDENKMDIELPLTINLLDKYSKQINQLSKENKKLSKKIEENTIINNCKRFLIKKGLSEEEAHKHILQYAMNNHIDKIEACNRLLTDNS
ncbi:hypothetical protein ACAG96_06030 [Candidatus Izemoplasma sp. B36]|uniref:hypothetical protein n=1 Tax=Candidatus Izemoplasma sp. B36 TaxID=3242468 RepID=UPI0035580771